MGDYISREAVLKAYEEEQKRGGAWRFEALIGSVPAENVRDDVRSNWVQEISRKPFLSVLYKCEKCGHLVDRVSNFCPNCGARMTEE